MRLTLVTIASSAAAGQTMASRGIASAARGMKLIMGLR
jgi:hypothetical protein